MSKGKRKKESPEVKINRQMEKKLVILSKLVLLAFIVLVVRLIYVNVVNGDKYEKQVLSQAQQQYSNRVLPAKRGDIYDRNGNILATSNKIYKLILDCKVANYEEYTEETVRALTTVFELDEAIIRKTLEDEETKNSQYQVLKKDVSVEQKRAFEKYVQVENTDSDEEKERKNKIQGIWFEEDFKRVYPFNELACDTIGFTFSRDSADWGVEGYYNTMLSGVDGRKYGSFVNSSDLEQTIISPTNGVNITTTIDVGIQQIVEKYVDAFNEAIGAAHVGVIVEDPSTGEILAMDGGDRYDLNQPRDLTNLYTEEELEEMSDADVVAALNSRWSNFCVTDAFEPGSTVKPLVVASALEKGKITTEDTFACDGSQVFGAAGNTTMIKCAAYPDAHGTEDLSQVIAYSCNDAMMQIAGRMGSELFVETQNLFNLGQRTGIDIPGEGYGLTHTAASLGETELACSSFGQGFTCTMIQEISAICSVINGGYYYQPHVVKEIEGSDGITKTNTSVLTRQTVSESVSANIREYMRASVDYGTAMTSKVQGYSSGGKTGTAEKLPRGNGKYLVSFIGFAPVENPELVIYVVVDEPKVDDQASSTYAQYIAQAILYETLPYMNIPMDEVYDGYVEDTELWEGFDGHVKTSNIGTLDENGNLVDANGNRIDWEGNRIDAEGYLLDADGNYKYDENGYYIMSEYLDVYSSINKSGLPEGVSDLNVPGPLADTTEVELNNDMESQGLTNEEAGLE